MTLNRAALYAALALTALTIAAALGPGPGVRRRIVRAPDHRRRGPPPSRRRARARPPLARLGARARDDRRSSSSTSRSSSRRRARRTGFPDSGTIEALAERLVRRLGGVPHRSRAGAGHRRRPPALHGAHRRRRGHRGRARVPVRGDARRGRAVAAPLRLRVDARHDGAPHRDHDRLLDRRARVPDAPASGPAREPPVVGQRTPARVAGDAGQRGRVRRRHRAAVGHRHRARAPRRRRRSAARLPEHRRCVVRWPEQLPHAEPARRPPRPAHRPARHRALHGRGADAGSTGASPRSTTSTAQVWGIESQARDVGEELGRRRPPGTVRQEFTITEPRRPVAPRGVRAASPPTSRMRASSPSPRRSSRRTAASTGLTYRVDSRVADRADAPKRSTGRSRRRSPATASRRSSSPTTSPSRCAPARAGSWRGVVNPYEQAKALQDFFLDGELHLRPGRPATAAAPTRSRTSSSRRRGFCEQFAGAFAAMARAVGLPTRVAVGFAPGVYDEGSGEFSVRARDAHAWPEVWLAGLGWTQFEPTPAGDEPGQADPSIGQPAAGSSTTETTPTTSATSSTTTPGAEREPDPARRVPGAGGIPGRRGERVLQPPVDHPRRRGGARSRSSRSVGSSAASRARCAGAPGGGARPSPRTRSRARGRTRSSGSPTRGSRRPRRSPRTSRRTATRRAARRPTRRHRWRISPSSTRRPAGRCAR